VRKEITLVIGGCRSGKSSFALNRANEEAAGWEEKKNKCFIATSVPTDHEMEKRVEKHKKERGDGWHTIEEPVKIHEKINQYSQTAGVILVDCLTLWGSNLLFHSYAPSQIEKAIFQLGDALEQCHCSVFLVSNEVGGGIVPENALAREFRDLAGLINQRIAAIADTVVMMFAGIDVQIKPGR